MATGVHKKGKLYHVTFSVIILIHVEKRSKDRYLACIGRIKDKKEVNGFMIFTGF